MLNAMDAVCPHCSGPLHQAHYPRLGFGILPMLEGEAELTLETLNLATQAWLEKEYHHRRHAELKCSPLQHSGGCPQPVLKVC